ncbi:MAG TPA: hypothetical protein VEP49_09060 [Acidimicrobiia bacterium]|nr:hypothetical protein [Acidimicrobiia bacterium]
MQALVKKALVLALVLVVVLGALGAPGASARAAKHPPKLTLAKVVDANGAVTTAVALRAYAAQFGALPGVAKPSGGTDISATTALSMVFAHWSELTFAQRRAVYRDIGWSPDHPDAAPPTTAAGGPGRHAPLLPAPTQAQDRQTIAQAVIDLAAKFGRPLGFDPAVVFPEPDASKDPAFAFPTGPGPEQPVTGCRIMVNSVMHNQPADFVPAALTHEVAHCFQFVFAGTLGHASTFPAWYTEGSANWAARSLRGGYEKGWVTYLHVPQTALYQRSYDAIGFYGHLAYTGVDVWKTIPAMALANSSAEMYGIAVKSALPSSVDDWGPGQFRSPEHPHWDTSGPSIPSTSDVPPVVKNLAVASGDQRTVHAGAYSTAQYDVTPTADVVRVDIVGGRGRIGDDGSIDAPVPAQYPFCARTGGCACQDGQDTTSGQIDGVLRIGLGGPEESAGTVTGISLDDWCRTTPTTTAAAGHASTCEMLLPTADVQRAVGVSLGGVTVIEPSAFDTSCVWLGPQWTLSGNRLNSSHTPNPHAWDGLPCDARGATNKIVYCLRNAGSGSNGGVGVGGNLITRSWSLLVTAQGITMDQFVKGIVPLLARTGA